MVGYVYWQQNRTLQAVGALTQFIQSQYAPPPAADDEDDSEEEDDRASVHEEKEVEVVEAVAPAPADEDDVNGKTAAELRDILTKKGIPFGKRDSKNVLLQLIKASS
jgi:hypothetical protein